MTDKVKQVLQVIKVLKPGIKSKRRLSCNTCNTYNTFYTSSGFTLVELLIYMALMAIFLTVLMDVFTTTLDTKLTTENDSALSSDTRYIFSKLSYDIRNADSVLTPATGSAGTTLSLVRSGVTSTYASASGNFVLTTNGNSMSLNSLDTNLYNLSFTNVSISGQKPSIKVSLTLKSKINIRSGINTESINTTIGTR